MLTIITILLQGILEAFPVSSSMHLALIGPLFGLHALPSDIMHVGTTLAFTIFCWPFIVRRLRFRQFDIKIIAKLVIATLPTIIIGWLIKHSRPMLPEVYCNIIAATAMLLADMRPRNKSIITTNFIECFIIGMFISLALIPGVSRMGITFTMFRLFQFRRFDALFCALLMGIPITAGAGLVGIIQNAADAMLNEYIIYSLIAGMITLMMLRVTFSMLKHWYWFGFYRILLSIVLLFR